jgi:hypothetical protein
MTQSKRLRGCRNSLLGQKPNRCRLSVAFPVAMSLTRLRRCCWRTFCVSRAASERQQVFFADLLLSGAVYPGLFEQAGLVCLSLMRTSAPARARYLVQRIRRRAPGAQVLVGLWGSSPAGLAAAKAAFGSSVDIVTSFYDAVAEVSALVSGLANGDDSSGDARPSRSESGAAAG